MTESKTKVSIVVAQYNREDIVLDTLRSIQQQTFTKFECIVIDDRSTDNSRDKILEFCSIDTRFKYYENSHNSGKCESYNRGIHIASGEYIVFIDNDDIFDKSFLYKLYDSIDINKTDMATCNYGIWSCDTDEIVYPKFHVDSVDGGIKSRDDFINKEWYIMFPPQVWTKIFRRKIIIENKLRFLDIPREGNYFIHTYQYFCRSVSVVNEYLVKYRQFSDLSRHSSGANYYDRTDLLYKIAEFKKEYIKNYEQRRAWDAYVIKFINEIYKIKIIDKAIIRRAVVNIEFIYIFLISNISRGVFIKYYTESRPFANILGLSLLFKVYQKLTPSSNGGEK